MTSPANENPVARARAALAASPIASLRALCVEQLEEGLLISGSVGSFYQKQVAQEVVRGIARDLPIRNNVFVHYDDVRLADD